MKSLFRSLVERMMVKAPAYTASAPIILGRWGIQYDEKIIDRKIIQANEDHCGCCVVPKKEAAREMATTKVSVEMKKKTVVHYEKTEEYLVPYVM